MSTKLEFLAIGCAAVLAGTVYVLVHEQRRKAKNAAKALREAPISKEMLLQILNKSAEASKAVIERIRVEVKKIQQQRNLSDEHALQLFQQNFEHSLDQLIGAIRKQHQVTEKSMDASFKLHQSDPEDYLKEIMTFNAVMLEKELRPIKEQVDRMKRAGTPNQLDPQILMQVQMRISQAVQQRFKCTDDQVMQAVEIYGAKNDPSFKPILQRIATTLSTSLS